MIGCGGVSVMKKDYSNRSSRNAFRSIYLLPVLALVVILVYYLIGAEQNGNPVISKARIKPEAPSAVQESLREIDEETEQESELDTEEQVSAQNDGMSPLRELAPTDAQSQLLYEAEEVLVQTCMNERGFEYITNPYVTKAEQEKLEPIPPKPGDIEAARTRGYGISESIEMGVPPNDDSKESVNSDKEIEVKATDKTDSEADPNSELLATMSPEQQQAWNEAFFGRMDDIDAESPDAEGSIMTVELPSQGGRIRWDSHSCLSNARREIFGSSMKQVESLIATQALFHNIATAASQDAEYQGALDQWRDCMLSHDLPYQNPGEAANALYLEYSEGKLDIGELHKKEIRYASIEASCFQQYSVGDVYTAAEHRAEAKIRETEAEKIKDLRAEFQNALISAERYAPHPEGGQLR
jgi:hypothetical protein